MELGAIEGGAPPRVLLEQCTLTLPALAVTRTVDLNSHGPVYLVLDSSEVSLPALQTMAQLTIDVQASHTYTDLGFERITITLDERLDVPLEVC